MSIISDTNIIKKIIDREITIEPFDIRHLGSNSYDIHLGRTLGIYEDLILDCKKEPTIRYIEIPNEGFIIKPEQLYLGITEEYTETSVNLMPNIDGKSSIGRLGIFIHVTAGRGDAGFIGHWTLEITCIHPIKIYHGMPIGQISYETIEGFVKNPYNKKRTAKYQNKNNKPIKSMMFKNWNPKRKKWL